MMDKILVAVGIITLVGRISSYNPGNDGFSGRYLPGAVKLGLSAKYWRYEKKYPIPVCAMRVQKGGDIDFGDLVTIRAKKNTKEGWKSFNHFCVVLDSGPWGCEQPPKTKKDKKKNVWKWHVCSPGSQFKGKLPKGWRWKSIIDIVNPSGDYTGGTTGRVDVIHMDIPYELKRDYIVEKFIKKGIPNDTE